MLVHIVVSVKGHPGKGPVVKILEFGLALIASYILVEDHLLHIQTAPIAADGNVLCGGLMHGPGKLEVD